MKTTLKLLSLLLCTALWQIGNAQTPTITSFTPIKGDVGTTITITGTNFNTTAANNVVIFGATAATVTAATTTSLTVTVPSGATYAPITVLNKTTGLLAYSIISFTPTFTTASGTTTINYADKVDFYTGSGSVSTVQPSNIAIGDLDRDGKSDLAVTSYNTNNLFILRNISTRDTIKYVLNNQNINSGKQPSSVAIGDLDGDGKPDLVVANSGSDSISVFRNITTGDTIKYAPKQKFSTGKSPQFVAIRDLNDDGKPDLAVPNFNSNELSIFRNTSTIGAINFATKTTLTTGNKPQSVAIGDIDGDGKPDLAVANNYSNTVSIFKNTSTTSAITYTAASTSPNVAEFPQYIVIGDFDGDNKADLALASNGNSSKLVSILKNTSTTSNISYAKTDFDIGSSQRSIAIGDLNGDGMADLAIASFGGNRVSVLQNTSTGTGNINYATYKTYKNTLIPYNIAIGDLNNDGRPDLAVANGLCKCVSIYQNNPKTDQSITFTTLPSKTFGDAPFTLSATANSGLTVSYASSNTAVATVSGSTVTIVGAGTTTITATQAGDTNYNAATNVTQTLTINKKDQSITFTTLPSKTFGDAPFTLSATANSGLTVSYASSNTAVATVSRDTVTIVGVGTTTITASQAGNTNYNPATDATQVLTVNTNTKQAQIITFGTLPAKTYGDAPFDLSATGGASGSPIIYTATPSGRVSIVGNKVTIVGAGNVTITANQAGNTNYADAPAVPQTFCINPSKPTITITNNNTATPTLTSSNTAGTSTPSYQWYKEDILKTGATNPSLALVAGELGTFKVRISVDGCFAESDNKTIIITGDVSTPQSSASVYPNPAKDKVYFGEIGEVKSIQAIDAIGRSHAVPISVEGKTTVGNVSELPSGVYVLRIQTLHSTHSTQLLKQ